MERRTLLTVGLGALAAAVVLAVLVLTWGSRPELRWPGETQEMGFGLSMPGLTEGQTYVLEEGLLRVCVDGDGEVTVTDVGFDERANLEVTGWAAIPQSEALAPPEVPEDAEPTLEGHGLDRTRHTVATPCAAGADGTTANQTYLALEVRWTGGDRATGSGLRVGYTGANGRSSDIVGEVDLVLCAEEADCEELPWE